MSSGLRVTSNVAYRSLFWAALGTSFHSNFLKSSEGEKQECFLKRKENVFQGTKWFLIQSFLKLMLLFLGNIEPLEPD